MDEWERRRRDAGERAELAGEVGLVGEPVLGGEAGQRHRAEPLADGLEADESRGDLRRGAHVLREALGEVAARAAQLTRRNAEQRLGGGRLEVELHAPVRALVADPHRPGVEPADERAEALALHGPAVIEVDDHDDAAARELTGLARDTGVLVEVGVGADDGLQCGMGATARQRHRLDSVRRGDETMAADERR